MLLQGRTPEDNEKRYGLGCRDFKSFANKSIKASSAAGRLHVAELEHKVLAVKAAKAQSRYEKKHLAIAAATQPAAVAKAKQAAEEAESQVGKTQLALATAAKELDGAKAACLAAGGKAGVQGTYSTMIKKLNALSFNKLMLMRQDGVFLGYIMGQAVWRLIKDLVGSPVASNCKRARK